MKFPFLRLPETTIHILGTSTGGLDQRINDSFMPFAQWWEALILGTINIFGAQIPVVLLLLILGALFFTIYFKGVNVRLFPTSLRIVRGNYDSLDRGSEDGEHGEVNHFQALATAVSGTVGLGNISMVAVAISIGGPGATFWMILAGLLGMSTKFVECTLGVVYRDIDAKGNVFGGPMYYLSKGLKSKGYKNLGKVLAAIFAVLCIGASLGGGNAFQTNQAAAQIIGQFGIQHEAAGTLIGIAIAILVGIVIIGGIKRIAKVTEKTVPFMALLYVLAALFIIISNIDLVDDALAAIVKDAFSPKATVTGGFIGVMIQGFRRAAFSNEAGAGSSAIAHSAVKTRYAASEGLVGLLEPFIDTVLICTMTAVVLILFNMEGTFVYGDVLNNKVLMMDGSRVGGINLTSLAFENAISGSSYVLVVAVILFAFSTILSWSYYGLQAWKYLFGRGKWSDLVYKVIFLMFTILGAAITLDAVIKFSDAMILAMVFPNMIGLLFLFPRVRLELEKYLKAIQELKGRKDGRS
ncbi:alanine/glycine:cation symporter family protein [Flagellimonas flava]|uniref:Alanine or glycine:cation symporter, AGCS family n=1 Tax=Flagellimonas flava TaxID=570519 RepID=A0A1M5KNW7_9FLAO|nr:alanine/glycine:cation symporter family protein [Allomuricauda flava]SHG54461.1 alanine or glycine:cation symporter, AGCS family [Allomuricauda flava]